MTLRRVCNVWPHKWWHQIPRSKVGRQIPADSWQQHPWLRRHQDKEGEQGWLREEGGMQGQSLH